jgi:putative ABC transport system permease protein
MAIPPGVRRERWEEPDRRKQVEAELGFHLESKIEDLVARGVPAAEARAQALAEFGPIARVADTCDDIQRHRVARKSRLAAWHGFALELKATIRGLGKSPGFAAIAIATFGLGIGATTAVFSLLDGVLLKPLPYQHVDRLVRVWERSDRRETGQLTIADVRDFATVKSFDGVAAYRFRSAAITGSDGEAVQVEAAEVFANFFDLLGVPPRLGRTFAVGEDRPGASDAVMLSSRIWRDRFGADSTLIGRAIRINSAARTVIGILPDGFVDPFGQRVDVWFPSDFDAVARDEARSRRMHFLAGVARLAPGVSPEAGSAELAALSTQIEARFPESNTGHRGWIVPLQDAGVAQTRPMLLLVAAAVGCLLLLTCANLANLVFARALARSREYSLRAALGAGRGRIVRTILVEQLGLAAVGAMVGLAVAAALLAVATGGLAEVLPRMDRVALDGRAFLIAAAAGLVAAIASGLFPALLAIRGRGESSRLAARAALSRRGARGRETLLAVQVALASLLLIGAGLTAKSMQRLLETELGFVTERVWTFQVGAPPSRYPEAGGVRRLQSDLLERIRAIPGVVSAAASYALPMENRSSNSVMVEGWVAGAGPPPEAGYNAADGDYFRTLGIPILEGRSFDARDRDDAPMVAVVNRAFARHFFPNRAALGARFKAGPSRDGPWIEIVGVVGDIRRDNPAIQPVPEAYFPLSQDLTRQPSYSVRIAGDAAAVMARIRTELKALDADLPLAAVAPLDLVVRRTTRQPETLAAVLVGFAVLALVVAAIGIYGVISFLVAERRREIAVRLAVGASGQRVLGEMIRRGLGPLAVGLAAGLGGAALASGAVRRFLYEVGPTDSGVYLMVATAVVVTGLAGALIPAIRASRVPPAAVLRD